MEKELLEESEDEGIDCEAPWAKYDCEEVKEMIECFVFSQMTIHDEYKYMEQYQYLIFIEFQEMICRVALKTFQQ